MPSRAPIHIGLLFLFLVCASAGLSCQSVDARIVYVTVSGLTSDVSTLQVQVTLDGRASTSPVSTFRENLSQVEVHIPPNTSGDLGISLTAQGSDGCTMLAGQGHVQLDTATRYSVDISVSASQGCGLQVIKLGDGSVQIDLSDGTSWHFAQSDPPEKECPVTSLVGESKLKTFPFGTRVTIRPGITDQDRGSYVGVVSGCDPGQSECQVLIGADTRAVSLVVDRDTVCATSGFCWEHPRPQGQTLRKVRGNNRSDVWVVGDGTVLHYAGTYWAAPRRVRLPSPLSGIVTARQNEMIAVGEEGTVLRLLENSWGCPESLGSLRLNDAWGVSVDDFWVVGSQGTLQHWSSKQFVAQPVTGLGSVELFAIEGRSDTGDIWAVGEQGTVLHYDGTRWSKLAFPSSEALFGVWPNPDGSVWVVGDHGLAGLISGTQVRLLSTGVSTRLRTVFPSSSLDTWVAGDGGVLLRFDGTSFSEVESGTRQDLYSIWGADAGDVWAVGAAGTLLRYNGVYWTTAGSSRTPRSLYAVAGTPKDPVDGRPGALAVGDQGAVLRYSGADWVSDPAFSALPARALHAITAPSTREAWIAGDGGTILKWDGSQVVGMMTGTVVDLRGIWAGGGSVVAVGAAGALVHGNGMTWTATVLPAAGGKTLRAIWGSTSTSLWLVGDGGTILQWNGVAATPVPSGISESLRAIWGASDRDIWAVGDSGRILHYDGSTWSLHAQGSSVTPKSLLSVSGASSTRVFAVGDSGTLLYFDGRTWVRRDSGTIGTLAAVTALADGDMLAVGQGATILRNRNPQSTSQ